MTYIYDKTASLNDLYFCVSSIDKNGQFMCQKVDFLLNFIRNMMQCKIWKYPQYEGFYKKITFFESLKLIF